MAVSNQWFVRWSTPSVVFTDIARGYDDVNLQWNTETSRSPQPLGDIQYFSDPFYKERVNVKPDVADYKKKDRARLTGVTLWLTMLGLAQSQGLTVDTPPFTTLYKWKTIDFEFKSESHRQSALRSGKYIPNNVIPLGIEVWESRIFVTLPSWLKGSPATLATVSRSEGVDSPLLKPYPDWSYQSAFNKNNNCSGLTSVFRLNVDDCGRLWVLDSGQIEALSGPKQVCPPSIVVFDLRTDTMISRYVIPEKYVLQDSLLSNIVVDSRYTDCSDLHLYIADTWRFGLLVFRESDASFWRITHHYFYPDPFSSNYTLHGMNFQWTDGIFGLALSPVYNDNDRLLFFHSMSGNREFYVQTSVLRNSMGAKGQPDEFKVMGESRGELGQSSASAVDKHGVMFYGLVTRDSVGCWDTRKPYLRKNLATVAMNSETLVFPNDIKVDHDLRQNVWVISNQLPMFQVGSLDPEQFNYRILYADTVGAVRGTVCDPSVASSSGLTQRRFG